MAGIQLTGLASGMDWKTTVDQLMKIEQIPQEALKTKQTANTKVKSAFDTLKTNLTALQTAAKALQTGLTGYPRSATVSVYDSVAKTYSPTTGASVSTDSGAALGTFEFEVKSLGRASVFSGTAGSLRGSVAGAGALTLRDYGVTAGTFTVNGSKMTLADLDLDQTVSAFFGLTADAPDLTGEAISGLKATLLDSTGALSLDATTSVGATGDTSNFLSALGFSYDSTDGSTSHVIYKQTMPSSVLAKVGLGSLGGSTSFSGGSNPFTGTSDLTINGVNVGTFSSTDTLGSVVAKINGNSSTGVTASIDALNRKLVLRANSIGAAPITVAVDSGSGLDQVLGISTSSVVRGEGITYNLKHNGESVSTSVLTSDSSTLDISKYGFGSTKLTVSNVGTYSVQVTGSGASYKSKINTFISAYNSLKQMLDDSTKITVGADGKVQTSVFSNRSDINNLLSTVRSKIYSSVSDSSISSSFDSASKIGLGFDSSGLLSITDSTKLDSALANSPSSVDALLNLNKTAAISTASSQLGIATRINNLITVMVGTSGIVAAGKSSLTSQNSRLQSQIDAMTRSLAQTRANLEKSFIAMEQAQSKYQNMTQQITAAFK